MINCLYIVKSGTRFRKIPQTLDVCCFCDGKLFLGNGNFVGITALVALG